MSNKLIACLLIAAMLLAGAAFAATYDHDDDITFQYDDSYFAITTDDHTDDEHMVVLTDKNNGFIRIHLRELDDGETFPTIGDFAEIEQSQNTQVEQLEIWANFTNVFTYAYDVDQYHEEVFIAPVYDDDGDIDAMLTVNIGGDAIEDEDADMERSDLISNVVDTLRVDD